MTTRTKTDLARWLDDRWPLRLGAVPQWLRTSGGFPSVLAGERPVGDDRDVEELALAREQAARLRTAFTAGRLWIREGPGDAYPVEERELIVPALIPDYVFTIRQFRGRQCVVVEFGLHGGPPGLRWLHRFEPPSSPDPEQDQALMAFQEGVECGWIARSLARVTAGTSPVWTDFSWGHSRSRWRDVWRLFTDGQLDQVVAVLRGGGDSDDRHQDQADQIAKLAAVDDAATVRSCGSASGRRSASATAGCTRLTEPQPPSSCRGTALPTVPGVPSGRQRPATDGHCSPGPQEKVPSSQRREAAASAPRHMSSCFA